MPTGNGEFQVPFLDSLRRCVGKLEGNRIGGIDLVVSTAAVPEPPAAPPTRIRSSPGYPHTNYLTDAGFPPAAALALQRCHHTSFRW